MGSTSVLARWLHVAHAVRRWISLLRVDKRGGATGHTSLAFTTNAPRYDSPEPPPEGARERM